MAMPHQPLSESCMERPLTTKQLCAWAAEHAAIAKSDPAKFVNEVFMPLFFSATNFFPLVQFWLTEYLGNPDKIQCFVEMFKDICFPNELPALEIFPSHINLFRNRRLTTPHYKLSQKVTMALSIFMQYRNQFFRKIVPVSDNCCFLFAYHHIQVPVELVIEAILRLFVLNCLRHNVGCQATLDGLRILTCRLMALPAMNKYNHLLYACAKNFEDSLLDGY